MTAKNGGKLILKSPDDSVDTLGSKIALSRTISEIITFFAFYAEIQDGRQNGGKMIFGKRLADDSAHALGVKNFVEIALFRTVSEIHVFKIFYFHRQEKSWCLVRRKKVGHLVSDHFQKLMISRHLYNKPTCLISCE